MSYEQLIALAIANEDNRREMAVPEPWDEPRNQRVHVAGGLTDANGNEVDPCIE